MNLIEAMTIFEKVVETGSFSGAAEALQLHKPYITRAIQQLENTLEVRLIHRSTRKMSLTSEGLAFHQRCRQALEVVSDTFGMFSTAEETPKGKLRVELPVSLAKMLIIPALTEFKTLYPDIELVVGISDQMVDIIQEGIDCAVRVGGLKDSALVARKVGTVSMIACASPLYIEKRGRPERLKDLHQHLAINFFSGPNRKTMDWVFIQGTDEQTVRLKNSILVNDCEAALSAGLAGMGIFQGLHFSVKGLLEAGRLVKILPTHNLEKKPVWAMYAHKQNLAPKVRVFIEWLVQLFKTEGYAGEGIEVSDKTGVADS